MPTALVTGAAGFIGSHLCAELLRRGWMVRGLDGFTSYYDPALKERNVAGLAGRAGFDLRRADLREAPLEEWLEGVDVVWHLAAQAGVRHSWGPAFEEYAAQNILATQTLLEAVVRSKVSRLVYASSSSIYGEAAAFPVSEETLPRPISPYGVTKLAGEQLVRLYGANHGLAVVSLRYFTVYGPRQRPDMGFHRFFRALLRGEEIAVYGDGRQTRDFTYVDDVTEANILAAEKGEPGAAYNISGGSRVELMDVLRLMEDATGCRALIRHQPAQKGDPRNTGGDASAARACLGFAPRTPMSEGLARMAAWMRRYLDGEPEQA